MLIYICFDDTDVKGAPMGTGRLTRLFAGNLDQERFTVRGILRHQLPRLDGIPFTSNNSSACALIETDSGSDAVAHLTETAVAHLAKYASDGSDPGLCVIREQDVTPELVEFGLKATAERLTQKQAMDAVPANTLQGLGGTNDGIIGAAAAAGLTKYGWCGRFIEYNDMRSLSEPVTVADLNRCGVRVLCVDRDPVVPRPEDVVIAGGWIRPSLIAGQPVLQVVGCEKGAWTTVHTKRKKMKKAS